MVSWSALDGTAMGRCDVPTDLGAVMAVSAGDDHTCAVRSDGQLVCFGSNADGQSEVPTDLGAVVGVSAGYRHTCAIRSDGQLVCFGINGYGQCDVPTGFGSSCGSLSRLRAHMCSEIRWSVGLLWIERSTDNAMCRPDLGAVVAVSAGYEHLTCAARSDGQLVCFGLNDDGQCDVPADLGAVLRSALI